MRLILRNCLAMNSERTIGKRQRRLPGTIRPPTKEEVAWVQAMSRRRTRVPKGVFRYTSMEQANADWERWQAEAIAEETSVDR